MNNKDKELLDTFPKYAEKEEFVGTREYWSGVCVYKRKEK